MPRILWRWLLPALGLALAVRHWVWTPVLVAGGSMRPTLRALELAGVNKLAYRFGPPRRGDIVMVRTGRSWMVKRIIGLPGEEVALRAGVFFINGRPLAEPYVRSAGADDTDPGQLGPSRFVVAGDNRLSSIIAIVSRDRIVGRLVYWRHREGAVGPAT